MQKLTKNEFGLSSKHELWNRIKELEDVLRSRELSLLCHESTFNELNQELTDIRNQCNFLKEENAKLHRHNDYLLTLLSSDFTPNKNISFYGHGHPLH